MSCCSQEHILSLIRWKETKRDSACWRDEESKKSPYKGKWKTSIGGKKGLNHRQRTSKREKKNIKKAGGRRKREKKSLRSERLQQQQQQQNVPNLRQRTSKQLEKKMKGRESDEKWGEKKFIWWI